MKMNIKGGILVLIFSGVFLMIFPAFLDRWPTVFGVACVFLFIPFSVGREEVRWEHKLFISVLVCIVNIVLILLFCDKSILVYQVGIYLAACAACFLTLFLKEVFIKH